MSQLLVPVSYGELIDKISILEIKAERIGDAALARPGEGDGVGGEAPLEPAEGRHPVARARPAADRDADEASPRDGLGIGADPPGMAHVPAGDEADPGGAAELDRDLGHGVAGDLAEALAAVDMRPSGGTPLDRRRQRDSQQEQQQLQPRS